MCVCVCAGVGGCGKDIVRVKPLVNESGGLVDGHSVSFDVLIDIGLLSLITILI